MTSTPEPVRRTLLLPPMLHALEAWLDEPSEARAAAIGAAIAEVCEPLGLSVGRVDLAAPPLPELHLDLGVRDGIPAPIRLPDTDGEGGGSDVIGSVELAGDPGQAASFRSALEFVFLAVRGRASATRAARQLAALDVAVRGISAQRDLERVLQEIVDRVRDLADAEYAALGIVDEDGAIIRFITSGLSHEHRQRIGELPRGRGLLGLIIRENRTYRIPDIATHPERYGFPPNHPEMHTFLGMPIAARGEPVGRLYLTNKRGAAEFSADDERLVEMFALHAGIAIQNAKLQDHERRLAVVDERDRISRDLHDSVIQSIYAQTLSLDDVPDLVEDDPGEAVRRVDDAIEALHGVIRDIRNFIFGLRPVLLESGSLEEGLRHLGTELRRSGAVEVEVRVDDPAGALDTLPIELVAELLAVAREALSNIARHAAASHASLAVQAAAEALRLEIVDDGRGIDPEAATARGHHGLPNMRARIETLGGTFEVARANGGGTRIIVAIPRRAAGTREAERA
jgi:signal transduction histidine kinase